MGISKSILGTTILLLFMLKPASICGQPTKVDSTILHTLQNEISEITILATNPFSLAKDIFLVDENISLTPIEGIPLDKQLNNLVGVQSYNGENFAQDIRLSVRGYGARSAFGIRGIHILMDGIPLTTPDGTSQLDELNILAAREVQSSIGSPASTMGNASGGLLSFKSKVQPENSLNFQASLNTENSILTGLDAHIGNHSIKNSPCIGGQIEYGQPCIGGHVEYGQPCIGRHVQSALYRKTRRVRSALYRWTRRVRSALYRRTRRVRSALYRWTRRVRSALYRRTRRVRSALYRWTRRVRSALYRWTRRVRSALYRRTNRVRSALYRRTRRVRSALDKWTRRVRSDLYRRTRKVRSALYRRTRTVCSV